jgi:hypothetical protein
MLDSYPWSTLWLLFDELCLILCFLHSALLVQFAAIGSPFCGFCCLEGYKSRRSLQNSRAVLPWCILRSGTAVGGFGSLLLVKVGREGQTCSFHNKNNTSSNIL